MKKMMRRQKNQEARAAHTDLTTACIIMQISRGWLRLPKPVETKSWSHHSGIAIGRSEARRCMLLLLSTCGPRPAYNEWCLPAILHDDGRVVDDSSKDVDEEKQKKISVIKAAVTIAASAAAGAAVSRPPTAFLLWVCLLVKFRAVRIRHTGEHLESISSPPPMVLQHAAAAHSLHWTLPLIHTAVVGASGQSECPGEICVWLISIGVGKWKCRYSISASLKLVAVVTYKLAKSRKVSLGIGRRYLVKA